MNHSHFTSNQYELCLMKKEKKRRDSYQWAQSVRTFPSCSVLLSYVSLLHLTWLNYRCEDVTLLWKTVSRILNQSIFHHKSNIDAAIHRWYEVCVVYFAIVKIKFQTIIYFFFFGNIFHAKFISII